MAQFPLSCTQLFPLGRTFGTPGAALAMEQAGQSHAQFFTLHQAGFWGECCPEDQQANEEAITHGGRIISVYHTRLGVKLWVITEADRSCTTILLPSDY